MTNDDRLYRLEAKVDYLFRHLGIDPDVALMEPGFGLPSSDDDFSSLPQDGFSSSQGGFSSSPQGGFSPSLQDRLPSSFHDALNRGKLIEAIKIYRSATGVGLKEAKDAVDAMARNRR
jgi:ribosomal L7/L12-like protein